MSQETKYYAISKERLLYIESCERALVAADALAGAAEKLDAVKLPDECPHDEETSYCDSCAVEWEREMAKARVELRAALEAYRTIDISAVWNYVDGYGMGRLGQRQIESER